MELSDKKIKPNSLVRYYYRGSRFDHVYVSETETHYIFRDGIERAKFLLKLISVTEPQIIQTPKDLSGAIANAFAELYPDRDSALASASNEVETILRHVRDRLAQDFTVADLKNMSSKELWGKLFPDQQNPLALPGLKIKKAA